MSLKPPQIILLTALALCGLGLLGCGRPPGPQPLKLWLLLDAFHRPHWQSAEIEDAGTIDVQENLISLGIGKPMTGVRFTGWRSLNLPVTNYAIEFEAMRVQGQDFFAAITFPVRSLTTCATLVTGGWGGGLVGISSIDEQNANENATRGEHQFVNGQWYKFRLVVHNDDLMVWLDDRLVINTSIKGRSISLRAGDIEKCAPFGIATYMTEGKVRNLRVSELP